MRMRIDSHYQDLEVAAVGKYGTAGLAARRKAIADIMGERKTNNMKFQETSQECMQLGLPVKEWLDAGFQPLVGSEVELNYDKGKVDAVKYNGERYSRISYHLWDSHDCDYDCGYLQLLRAQLCDH